MTNQAFDTKAALLSSTVFGPISDYWIDAFQRSVLFLDVLRQRGNIAKQHNASVAPNVLQYEFEVLVDGRDLARPVNYGLVRIIPPEGTRIEAEKRPFIVVDPRAGHGPGIGGMKHESEIGVALAAGHPCYFIGFLPSPMPGQTVEDVCRAEELFVKTVAERHPDAEGKPVVIGNCQAGWQVMMMAALNPNLCGPIMLAGSPLSYWAGVRGKNPLRYLGGVLGGSWMTALSGDLGHGIFDGADLVRNFESMNLANTLWTKPYNVYSKVDTEVERFLDFETWWGSPVLLNAQEMQWIVDNLFIGNKLTAGTLSTSDGQRIDLRAIRSPIIVFCSWGDDITPPQQALGWITDLYDEDDEIVANGQTIVYTLHQSIGHLGIFVSGKVATREHQEFATAMDMIDLTPPGLYEAVITDVGEDTANPQLIQGRYLFRMEQRSLADIRALGNGDADDKLFAAAARVSDANLAAYRNTLAPLVRMMATEQTAETMRKLHPARLRFSLFSDENPFLQPVKTVAEAIRANRKPVAADNPLLAMEHAMSNWITGYLQALGSARDMMQEHMFLATYGSPLVQATMGPGSDSRQLGHAEREALRDAEKARLRAELEPRFDAGGIAEAMVRALIYIRLPERSIDERGFTVLRALRQARPAEQRLSLMRLKELFTEQFLLLTMDEARAVRSLAGLLPPDPAMRAQGLSELKQALGAAGYMSPEGARRLAEIEALFGVKSAERQDADPAQDHVPQAKVSHKTAKARATPPDEAPPDAAQPQASTAGA